MTQIGKKRQGSFAFVSHTIAFLCGFALATLISSRSNGLIESKIADDLLNLRASAQPVEDASTASIASSDGVVSRLALESDPNESPDTVSGDVSATTTAETSEVAAPAVDVTEAPVRDFLTIAKKFGTDKVQGKFRLPGCLANDATCTRPSCVKEECRPWGHYYQTMYQSRLADFSRDDTEPFQFLEIGFYNGLGYETYKEFMPKGEMHSMEISCLPEGSRDEGKWPWGNFASKNHLYQQFVDEERLHCGDASDLKWLDEIWKTKMKRDDAPPLKIVVDDASHISLHMITSVFFWFPRIEPGGLMVVEDIQPIHDANLFRTQFLPQIMNDLHFCGDPKETPDEPCFPTLQPLLASIHCEMHICIFQRNDKPAYEADLVIPEGALDHTTCKALTNSFGRKNGG
eukprot:CAMPEP_0194042840 /NCGR_PEP_ID=MMETSP0009_2-20130614/14573_1 /TAXON_ID=210454 /ORGANISM="Grammatophora oceanica, Strain CCMP 410" /LENGTH=401 /DNA_ID=CAMNT_0038686847 /DNA_START=98 /DNA_END=1303 /DNA_ORIENTATION=+